MAFESDNRNLVYPLKDDNKDRIDSTKYADETNTPNWGVDAKRSMYHTSNSQGATFIKNRNLLGSRLWHGVPQLTTEQLSMFEAAYIGHTFIFVVNVPKFMTTGYYKNKNMHFAMQNLKAVIERASTGFSGAQNIVANAQDQEDGNGKKISHIVNVSKEQGNISIRLHEFAGLPVKNAIELWLTGIYDYKSQRGNYHGNLGIPGGWCLQNHSMSILVVQVTPDWTSIQDAAYYFNMVPIEVPFEHFQWTKGEQTIVEDYDLEFFANEERSPAIMYAAERYMNNRVLSMVATSVYNSRQFVVNDDLVSASKAGFYGNLGRTDDNTGSRTDGTATGFLDNSQYNIYYTDKSTGNSDNQGESTAFIKNDASVNTVYERIALDGEGADKSNSSNTTN